MSFNDKNDGWSTPKRCESLEKDLHFMNLMPHEATIVKESHKKNSTDSSFKSKTHRSIDSKRNSKVDYDEKDAANIILQTPYVKSKSTSKATKEAQMYQHQSNSTNHQLANNNNSDGVQESGNNTNYKYEQRNYEHTKAPHSHAQHSTHMSPSQEFVEAKDEIIDQKNIIIQKQKSIISQLRQTNMELEELLIQKKHELRSSNNERMQKHLREYQHDISLLKQQVADAKNSKASEIEKLQRQLGKCEYEYGKLQIQLKEVEISKSGESNVIQKELKKKELDLKAEQQKNAKIVQDIKSIKQQNQKLQAYLEELATAEELKELQTELRNLKNEKEKQTLEHQQLEKKIDNEKSKYQDKELTCKKLQMLNIEQQDELSSLKNLVQKYHAIEEKGGLSFEEQEDIVGENVQLRKENVELRMSLQKRQVKLDGLFKDNVQQKIQYEEQNIKVADLIQQLQEDTREKSIALTKTNSTNQDILSESLKYQADLKIYKERYNEEFERLLTSLGKEMGLCVEEVKSFLNLCISRIKGDEPSLNSLLGLRDSPDKPDHPLPAIDHEYMRAQLKEMTELRRDVDELRRLVSEHYAQEIGDNMCITQ